jgi:predicted nucleic acid-binding Zn ribbon protein
MRNRYRRNNDDGQKRGGNPVRIGNSIDAMLEQWLPGFHVVCKEWEVVERWHEIATGRLSEVTKCSRVEDGVLYVEVLSAAWRQDLIYLKDPLKEAIKRVTGCDTIKDIVFY